LNRTMHSNTLSSSRIKTRRVQLMWHWKTIRSGQWIRWLAISSSTRIPLFIRIFSDTL
jgi:hypothetical protein